MSTPPAHTDRARAESFGAVARDYDRFRPSYPAELIRDLVAPAAAPAPQRALDIGCGTGKVAVALRAAGLSVLGVEIDPQMAEVARGHGVPVEVSDFEGWDDAGRRFDLITCGQAWHWIDPHRGAAKAARLLRPGGTLALFWNYDDLDEDVQGSLDEIYARHAPELARDRQPRRDETPHLDALRIPAFAEVRTRRYRWETVYRTAEWVGRAATHSDHIGLPAEQRDRLLAEVTAEIDRRGGALAAHFGTYTILARTPE